MKLSLWPFRLKFVGFLLFIISLFFAYLYFWQGKPEMFNTKVYALLSVYLEQQSFTVIQTNILDELAAITFITSLVLISFTKERIEKPNYAFLRGKAIIQSFFITISLWIIIILFIYGIAIFIFSSSVFAIFLISYIILFQTHKLKFNIESRKKARDISN